MCRHLAEANNDVHLVPPLTWTRLWCPGIPHAQLWSRKRSDQLITCETSHTTRTNWSPARHRTPHGPTDHLRDIAHHTPGFVDVRISHVTDVDFHLTRSCSSDFMYPPMCSHAPSLNKHIEHVHSISLDKRPDHLQYCSRFTVSGLSELGQP